MARLISETTTTTVRIYKDESNSEAGLEGLPMPGVEHASDATPEVPQRAAEPEPAVRDEHAAGHSAGLGDLVGNNAEEVPVAPEKRDCRCPPPVARGRRSGR